MNKLSKYILVWIALWSVLFASFSSADNLPNSTWNWNGLESIWSYKYSSDALTFNWTKNYNLSSNYDFVCLLISRDSSSSPQYSLDNSTYNNVWSYSIFCLNSNSFYLKCPSGTCKVNAYYFKNWEWFVPPIYTSQQCQTEYSLIPISSVDQSYCTNNNLCPSSETMTSLQCQTEYNLIPINEVTANYCKLNFNLINPAECPIQSGSGAVNWSSLFINGTQYPWNASISVYIPEYIARSITYNNDENIIDIEWYNADEDYINNVIDNEKLTPTNEDFATLINGLISFIPYLFICLLFFRFVRIINRIWK